MSKNETKSKVGVVGASLGTEDLVRAIIELAKADNKVHTIAEVTGIIGYLKDAISQALSEGQRVQITGFVTFTPSYRAARKGNNVVTGELMDIPECVAISAKAGKVLKDAVRYLDDDLIKSIKEASAKKKEDK